MPKITTTHNLEALHSDIASQWHPTKNNGILPSKIAPYSNKKYWWICEHGHEWEASAGSRHRSGCNVCRLLKLHLKADQTVVDAANIFSELLPTQEKYDELKNSYIYSTKLAKWKCATCGDIWQNQIRKRAAESQGCPYCAEKKVAPSKWNSLSTKYPQLMKEWDFEKNTRNPDDELCGSHHQVHWKCARGHSWSCEIRQRTRQNSSCPKCSYQISKPQKRIFAELAYIFPNAVELSHKVSNIEIDIFLPTLRLSIEYDGSHFHKSPKSQINDVIKFKKLKELGIFLIRIRAIGLNELSDVPCILESSEDSIATVKDVLSYVEESSLLEDDQRSLITNYKCRNSFANEEYYQELLLNKRIPLHNKSLAHTHPYLVEEWSPNNYDLPTDVTSGMHVKRKWLCKTCGYEYDASIYSRAKLETGCGYCSGRHPSKERNLLTEFPEIARQLHPDKNIKKANEISPKSNDKVWWFCDKGHEYEMVVGNRTDKNQSCPYCKNKRAHPKHNLAINSPELSKWLDVERTGKTASELTPHASYVVHWKCPNGHTWKRRIDHQVRSGLFCREC